MKKKQRAQHHRQKRQVKHGQCRCRTQKCLERRPGADPGTRRCGATVERSRDQRLPPARTDPGKRSHACDVQKRLSHL
ncbi:MAG: hypothetical protein KDE06_05535, partial [Rhodobacteraceae bacterium]|nr:hypothetical protein [Paracoccaceae bacterium]